MRVPKHLLLNSYGIYSFRIAIPIRLRQYLGKREIKQSLKTKSLFVATQRAQILTVQAHNLFDKLAMTINKDWLRICSNMTLKNVMIDLGNGKKITADELEIDPQKEGDKELWLDTINTAKDQPTTSTPLSTKLFSELFEEYCIVRKQKKPNMRGTTIKGYGRKADLFKDIFGDQQISSYKFQDADRFLGLLQELPKNWKKNPKYRDYKTLTEVLGRGIPEKDRMAVGTINSHIAIISGVFKLAVTRGYIPYNPFADKQVLDNESPDEKWFPFSDEDLDKIFDPTNFVYKKKNPSFWWVPLICVTLGCRTNEACQLNKSDIQNAGGFSCIRFTDNGKDQQVKGRNSKRIIPVSQSLIDLGFIDYIDNLPQGSKAFPDLTQGEDGHWDRKVRRWFNDSYLKKINVKKDKLSFRSFRRLFVTKLRAAGVDESYIAEMLGHSKGKGSYTTFKTYANRGEVPPLIKALNTYKTNFLDKLLESTNTK